MRFLQKLNAKRKKNKFRIIGMDLGTKNVAYSVSDHYYKGKKVTQIELIDSGMIKDLFTSMKAGWEKEIDKFRDVIIALINKHKPDLVIGELFFARGFRSNLAIPITFMLGTIREICKIRGIQCQLVHAAVWKNNYNKNGPEKLDASYSRRLKKESHLIDSLLISLFPNPQAYQHLNKKRLAQLISHLRSSTFAL